MTKMVLVIYESFIGTLSTFIHINTIMHSCVHISVNSHCPKFQHLFIYSSSCQRNNVTSTILYNLHHTTSPLCLFLFYWHLYIVYSLEQCYFILEIHVFQQLLCHYYFILSFTSWIPVTFGLLLEVIVLYCPQNSLAFVIQHINSYLCIHLKSISLMTIE